MYPHIIQRRQRSEGKPQILPHLYACRPDDPAVLYRTGLFMRGSDRIVRTAAQRFGSLQIPLRYPVQARGKGIRDPPPYPEAACGMLSLPRPACRPDQRKNDALRRETLCLCDRCAGIPRLFLPKEHRAVFRYLSGLFCGDFYQLLPECEQITGECFTTGAESSSWMIFPPLSVILL